MNERSEATNERKEVVASTGAGRIDRYLAQCDPKLSRSRIRALIEEGRVTVDGRPVKPSDFPLQRAARLGQAIRDEELELVFADGSRVFTTITVSWS